MVGTILVAAAALLGAVLLGMVISPNEYCPDGTAGVDSPRPRPDSGVLPQNLTALLHPGCEVRQDPDRSADHEEQQ